MDKIMGLGRHKGDRVKRGEKRVERMVLEPRKGRGRTFNEACRDFWSKRDVVNHGFSDNMGEIARG